MAIFGVQTKETPELIKFIYETNGRLQEGNLIYNPFHGCLVNYNSFIIVDIKPIYLNFPLYGAFFMLLLPLIFTGFRLTYWLIPGFLFLSLSFFWSSYFYYYVLKKGIKKAGHKEELKLLSTKEALNRLNQWAKEK